MLLVSVRADYLQLSLERLAFGSNVRLYDDDEEDEKTEIPSLLLSSRCGLEEKIKRARAKIALVACSNGPSSPLIVPFEGPWTNASHLCPLLAVNIEVFIRASNHYMIV